MDQTVIAVWETTDFPYLEVAPVLQVLSKGKLKVDHVRTSIVTPIMLLNEEDGARLCKELELKEIRYEEEVNRVRDNLHESLQNTLQLAEVPFPNELKEWMKIYYNRGVIKDAK